MRLSGPGLAVQTSISTLPSLHKADYCLIRLFQSGMFTYDPYNPLVTLMYPHFPLTLTVTAQLACMSENCRDMHGNLMMGSGRLPEGGLEDVGARMEAGEPLEGRLTDNDEVSMSHGCSRQDLDYLAHQPILAWSTQCRDESPAQEAAQQSLDASVSLMIVYD